MAELQAKQSGQTAFGTSDVAVTATVSSYTLANSIVVFTQRGGNNISNQLVRMIRTNSTTLTFERDASGSVAHTIEWEILEFDTDVDVQDVEFATTGVVTEDITITAVVLANSWMESGSGEGSGGTIANDEFIEFSLTTTTNARMKIWAANRDRPCNAQVIEHIGADTQTVSPSPANTDSSGTDTFTAVVMADAYVKMTTQNSAKPTDDGVWTIILTNTTTITCERGSTVSAFARFEGWVIEFTDGTTVQRGTQTLVDTDGTDDVTITAVTIAESSVDLGGANFMRSAGRGGSTSDDAIDSVIATGVLFSTTVLRITRDSTLQAVTYEWQITEWNAAITSIQNDRTISSGLDVSDAEDQYRLERIRQQTVLSPISIESVLRMFREKDILLSDPTSILDVVSSFRERFKLTTDEVSVNDALSVEITIIRGIIIQSSTSIADAVRVFRNLSKRITDEMSLQDQLLLERQLTKRLLDSMDVQDALNTFRIRCQRVVSPSVELTDNILAEVSIVLGRLISSSVDLTDTLLPFRSLFHVISDQVDAQDQLLVQRIVARLVVEDVSVQDQLRVFRNRCRVLTDNFDVSDLLTTDTSLVISILLQSSIDTSDELRVFRERMRLLVDQASTTDAVFPVRQRCRLLADNIELNDFLDAIKVAGKLIERTLIDGVSATDLLLISRSRFRLITSAMDVTDQMIVLREVFRVLISSLGVTDTLEATSLVEKFRLLSDSFDVTDTSRSFRDAFRVLVNSVSVSDDVIRQYMLLRLLHDDVDITDTLIRSIITTTTINVVISMALELLKINMSISLRGIVMDIIRASR